MMFGVSGLNIIEGKTHLNDNVMYWQFLQQRVDKKKSKLKANKTKNYHQKINKIR